MKRLCVYIIRCADNSYYTGVTNNLDRIVNEHNFGRDPSAYTYSRKPVTLVFYEVFNSPFEAFDFEKKVKGWTRAKKEAIINDNWEKLKDLSICKNETGHLNNKNVKSKTNAIARTSTPLSVTERTES
jgi:putative endonuclease